MFRGDTPLCRTGLGLALMDDGHDESTNGDDHNADAEDHNKNEEGTRHAGNYQESAPEIPTSQGA